MILTIYYAEMKYKRHTFRCVSTAKNVIEQTLRRGVTRHCEHNNIRPDHLLARIARGAYNLRTMETGVPYVDSWPIGVEAQTK